MLPKANEPENGSQATGQGQAQIAPEQNQSEPITRKEFTEGLSEFRTMLQEALNKQYQGVQSQNDKFKSNVQTQIGSLEQTLRALQGKGLVNMSEAQINQAVREDALDRIIAQQNSGQQAPTPGQGVGTQADPQGNDFNAQVTAMASRIEQRYGISLEDNDPEIAQFEIEKHAQSPNAEDYLMAIQQASQAKAERMKKQSIARSPGSLPSTPDTSNPLNGVTDLSEIWSQTSLGKLRG